MNETDSSKPNIIILLKEITDSRIRTLICAGFCSIEQRLHQQYQRSLNYEN